MASDDTPPKTKHRISLTRAALLILEGCLQDPGPCSANFQKIALWNKVWDKIRSANNRMIKVSWAPQGRDLEKDLIKIETESDYAWVARQVEWNEARKAWEDEVVTVVMNDKMRDTCRATIEWIHTHRDDPKARIKLAGAHATSLLIALDLAKAEADEDFECDLIPALKIADASA